MAHGRSRVFFQADEPLPIILEMTQGQVDRGADISFLSQYPSEAEVLFAPMTFLEPEGARPQVVCEDGKVFQHLRVAINVIP